MGSSTGSAGRRLRAGVGYIDQMENTLLVFNYIWSYV